LQTFVGGGEERGALENVATVLRNHVGTNAARGDFGVDGARLITDLLEHHLVEVALHAAVALDAVQRHAIDLEGGVAAVGSMDREVAMLHARCAPTSGSASRAPGSIAPSDGMLRPVGTASRTCRDMTTCCTAVWTSTTGDCPETLTVSSSAPTFRSALTWR
jgi:hypothetical protein